MSKRWSGYAKQTVAWRQGYDWANDLQDERITLDILEELGYDFHSTETDQFEEGATFANNEQVED